MFAKGAKLAPSLTSIPLRSSIVRTRRVRQSLLTPTSPASPLLTSCIHHVAVAHARTSTTPNPASSVPHSNASTFSSPHHPLLTKEPHGYFQIPDVLADWPWQRSLNPDYEEVKYRSEKWTESFKFFDPASQAVFNKGNFNLFAALAYPAANKERLRTGCDYMNLIFVFDEKTDFEPTSKIRQFAKMISSALRNPNAERPKGEDVLGEMTRQFWARAIPTASETSQRRFVDAFEAYVYAVVQEAEDRTKRHVRDIESYMQVRRDTVAMMPAFALLELGLDLPDSVVGCDEVKDMIRLANEMIFLSNDICSFNVEQARDDGHNIVAVVMNQHGCNIQDAMAWVDERYNSTKKAFLERYNAINAITSSSSPSSSHALRNLPASNLKDLNVYMDGLGNFVRANHQWCFESQRYFGEKGVEVMKFGWVELLPKVSSTTATQVDVSAPPPLEESRRKEVIADASVF